MCTEQFSWAKCSNSKVYTPVRTFSIGGSEVGAPGDLRPRTPTPKGPNSIQIFRSHPSSPYEVGALSYGKSWIRPCLGLIHSDGFSFANKWVSLSSMKLIILNRRIAKVNNHKCKRNGHCERALESFLIEEIPTKHLTDQASAADNNSVFVRTSSDCLSSIATVGAFYIKLSVLIGDCLHDTTKKRLGITILNFNLKL